MCAGQWHVDWGLDMCILFEQYSVCLLCRSKNVSRIVLVSFIKKNLYIVEEDDI